MKNFKMIKAKHGPTIACFIGVGCLIYMGYSLFKAGPKVKEAIEKAEEEKAEKNVPEEEDAFITEEVIEKYGKLTKIETIKVALPELAISLAFGGVGIFSIVRADMAHVRRFDTMSSMYDLSKLALKEYRAKVIETIGEKKEKKINDEVLEDRLKKLANDDQRPIYAPSGYYLFYDTYFRVPFYLNHEQVQSAINRLDSQMNNGFGYVSINELYSELGIPLMESGVGDRYGFIEDDGLLWNNQIRIIHTEIPNTHEPCHGLAYEPRRLDDWHRKR